MCCAVHLCCAALCTCAVLRCALGRRAWAAQCQTRGDAVYLWRLPTSGPAHGSLPPALLLEAREHGARTVAPLHSVRNVLAQGGREGVLELLLISHVELVVRSYLGAQHLCPFLRCLARETSWAWEETG